MRRILGRARIEDMRDDATVLDGEVAVIAAGAQGAICDWHRDSRPFRSDRRVLRIDDADAPRFLIRTNATAEHFAGDLEHEVADAQTVEFIAQSVGSETCHEPIEVDRQIDARLAQRFAVDLQCAMPNASVRRGLSFSCRRHP